MPGLEARLPILFSEGVSKGRLTLPEFVALSAANHARMYGMYPRKGVLAAGADADVAIWSPDKKVTLSTAILHDRAGYTPFDGMEITGWPETVVSAGRVVVEGGKLNAEKGSGRFIARGVPEAQATDRAISTEAYFFRALAEAKGSKPK